jgi:hypothetical protein
MPKGSDRTYVEDLKDPDEVLPPNCNVLLVDFPVENPRGHVPFTLLGDFLLDRDHSSAIEISANLAGFSLLAQLTPSTARLLPVPAC